MPASTSRNPAEAAGTAPPPALRRLVARFDPEVFSVGGGRACVRLTGPGVGAWDVLLHDQDALLVPADPDRRADALIEADAATWLRLAKRVGGGMEAFRSGRLAVRHDLHLGVGFLAATSRLGDGPGLRFRVVPTRIGRISTMEAGEGPPLIALHGLGATKASFLPTVDALAAEHRVIAVDLPGFGDSVKPLGAAYDAPFFARSMVGLLDALGLERASFAGNSMGGRVAIELGLEHRERVDRLVLLAPAVAGVTGRRLAPLVRLLRPELGLLPPAPRSVIEPVVRRLVPGAESGWIASGVDEFLRSFLEPRGRAAFFAAGRNLLLDARGDGEAFWARLAGLEPPSLFFWGRHDRLVPMSLAERTRRELPAARHLELDCGHVPQLERPLLVHDAMTRFLAAG